MYFSRLTLKKDYATCEDFQIFMTKNGYYWHQVLWTLFDRNENNNKKRDFIYYIDFSKSYPIFFIYSARKPFDTHNFWNIDYINGIKEFNPKIKKEQIFDFSARVFPRITINENNQSIERNVIEDSLYKNYKNIKNKVITSKEVIQKSVFDWLCHTGTATYQGKTKGFQILEVGFENILKNEFSKIDKNNLEDKPITFTSCDLRGRLKVIDPQEFKRTLFTGIGGGRAFGFGMLRIKPSLSILETE